MSSARRGSFKNPLINWVDERLPVFTMLTREYGTYPTPKNFNYFWNFGAIALFMLITMIVTGIFLAMNYIPNGAMAFGSVEHIMRDVNYGWMIRYLHMNGASFFFLAVYIHIFRGIYYGSFKRPRELLWIFGVTIYLLMMATAFMGYTLPWSQMGGWAATVITNLFTAIPLVGNGILELLQGGFSVDNPTLNRFFALHYLLPFVIVGVVGLHVWALHISGSNNPLGIDVQGPQDTIGFHPYYTMKDSFGLSVFLLAYVAVSFFAPNLFSHPDGYVEYDPMKTPAHIVPEWYFLPFYAILRSVTFGVNAYVGLAVLFFIGGLIPVYCRTDYNPLVAQCRKSKNLLFVLAAIFFALGYASQFEMPSGGHLLNLPLGTLVFVTAKLGGVLAMFGAVLILFFLPWLDTHPVRSAVFRPVYRACLLILVVDFCVLGYVGSQEVSTAMTFTGQIGTAYYLAFFLVILPVLSHSEKTRPLPASINEAVLKRKQAKAMLTGSV